MTKSKRYQEAAQLIEPNKLYSLEEAVELAQKTATTKFDASVELHLRLGINTNKSDQQVRGSVVLPHGTGKSKKLAVFCSLEKEKEARAAGAEIVGGEELINQIKTTGKIDFEVAIATPEMMPKLAAAAKILGPKGLMPSPKDGTVTPKIKEAVAEIKKGKINFKNDDSGNLHFIVGRVSYESVKLLANLNAVIEAVRKAKPASAKGLFIKTGTISSSMGPGIRLSL